MFTAHTLSLAGVLSLLLAQNAFAIECGPDQGHGAQVFANECGVCHAVTQGGATMMGPNLAGVYARTSGSLAGFSYSQAMRDKAVEWQAETLVQFITQPQAFVPGTYMPYMGLASADDRQAVACFLKEQH